MIIRKRICEKDITKAFDIRNQIDIYLELYGEEKPLIHKPYEKKPGEKPETQSGSKSKTESETKSESGQDKFSGVYEYGWTIGITGTHENWIKTMKKDDNALIIQLLFKTAKTNFRIREIAPSLLLFKELKPSLLDKISNYWQSFSPILGIVDKIPMKPGKDTLLNLIPSALSSLNLTQLSANELRWYVKSISTPSMEPGIEWCISRKAIKRAGNRITGNITVMIEECEDRSEEKDKDNDTPEFYIELRSRLLLKDFFLREYWLPRMIYKGQEEYKEPKEYKEPEKAFEIKIMPQTQDSRVL
ncbi:MAG: hypothetical protein JXB88_21200 [Spirochaetales bacterium]|nr:hypothetical protein [Spirochaetales bacterium]